MQRITFCVIFSLLAAPACLLAQTASSTSGSSQSSMPLPNATKAALAKRTLDPPQPFSRLALQGGIGIGGVNMQAAVEANRYLNIRGIGNYFTYTLNNVKVSGSGGSSGISASGKLNFAEAGAALDYYPWPNHGFRLSPGVRNRTAGPPVVGSTGS